MLEYILFIIGIALLIKGADILVEGSSALAKKFNVSALVIGLTIVAFGTSLPELVVSLLSALRGASDMAFGNIVGSNIANILLILGITTIIKNIKVPNSTTWKEIPFSLLGAVVLFIFANIFFLDHMKITSILRFEGLILLLFFAIFLYYVIELAKKDKTSGNEENQQIHSLSSFKITLFILGGLVALYFGGKWTVDGAVSLARLFGLSEYFIGLTIVAVGTSLPELVTSVIAGIKGNADISIGNVVGSNIFNIFFVLGLTALIFPITLPVSATIDLLVLLGTTILLFIFMFMGKRHELERWQGILFILLYVAYVYSLVLRG